MVRLSPAALLVVGVVLAIGCGPTAEVITTPMPPTTPSASPGAPALSGAPSSMPPGTRETGEPTIEPGASAPIPTPTSVATEGPAPGRPTGAVWQRVEDFPAGDAFEVTSVAAVDAGFVAVGFGPADDLGYFGRRQGYVWRSADGLAWQLTIDPGLENATPEHVVALGSDVYVLGQLSTCPQILNDDCVDSPEAGNAIWHSTAAGPFERLPQFAPLQGAIIDGVSAGANRLAVFGATGTEEQPSRLWTSTDALTWTETAALAGMDPVSALNLDGPDYVAFGTRYLPELEDIEVVTATSTDGASFVEGQAPALPGMAIEHVAFGPPGYVAVGYGQPLDGVLAGVALVSADGATWTQATDTDNSFAGNGLLRVHAVEAGYLALGFAPQADDLALLDGLAWFSADGQAWEVITPLDVSFTQLGSSASGAAGVVAFLAQQDELDDKQIESTIIVLFAPR